MTTLESKLCIIAIKIDHKYIYDKLEWNGVSSYKHCIYDELQGRNQDLNLGGVKV